MFNYDVINTCNALRFLLEQYAKNLIFRVFDTNETILKSVVIATILPIIVFVAVPFININISIYKHAYLFHRLFFSA